MTGKVGLRFVVSNKHGAGILNQAIPVCYASVRRAYTYALSTALMRD